MPLVPGLPRGTWSLADGGEWSWTVEAPRAFAQAVGAFVEAFAGISVVRSFSWGTPSAGEDVVTQKIDEAGEFRLSDLEASSPVDSSFFEASLDLLVRFEGETGVVANRCTLFAENEVATGDADGFELRVVLHTDAFRERSAGLWCDNQILASENAPRLARAFMQVETSLEAKCVPEHAGDGDRSAAVYPPVDFAALRQHSLQSWERAATEPVSAATRLLLRCGLAEQDLDRVFGRLAAGDRLRHLHDGYVRELQRAWQPVSGAELVERGVEAVVELSAAGHRLDIDQWRHLTAFAGVEPRLIHTGDAGYQVDEPVSGGAHAVASRLLDRRSDTAWSNHYLAATSALADGNLLFAYLAAPFDAEIGAVAFEAAYRLWVAGGALAVIDDRVTVVRLGPIVP